LLQTNDKFVSVDRRVGVMNCYHAVIVAAIHPIHQWCRRLSACVEASSAHFEHCFDLLALITFIINHLIATAVHNSNTALTDLAVSLFVCNSVHFGVAV